MCGAGFGAGPVGLPGVSGPDLGGGAPGVAAAVGGDGQPVGDAVGVQFLVAGFDEVEQVGGDGGEAFAQPVVWRPPAREVGVGGHGCSPFVYGLGAPVSAGVRGPAGGARNLEEAVTGGAGFRPARAGAQRPGELALGRKGHSACGVRRGCGLRVTGPRRSRWATQLNG